MKRADIISGAILMGLFGFMAYQSTKLDMVYRNSPGAGFFPLWLSLLALVAVAVILAGAFRRPAGQDRPVQWPRGVGLRRIAGALGGFLVYAWLTTVLGFILSTVAYMLFMARMLGARRWLSAAAVSVLTALGLFLLFRIWLKMELPTGRLPIP
ncbi:MAG: tripartite tricarboxylate transporter TctB family protein [Syntrophales bacterium]